MYGKGMATITFADGSIISVDYNGDCFIVNNKPVFPDDMSIVEIARSGEENETLHNVELMECFSVDGRYWFAFREKSQEEMYQQQLEETIQMLTDCLLEMSEIIYA